MGNQFGNFASREAAVADLEAKGFVKGQEGDQWLKRGPVDDWYGAYEKLAIVEIVECRVAPKYGGGQYYQQHFL